jgi:hypothetical protein
MKTAIVFIQIGNPIPGYALENIKRTTRLFAREYFFLVVDEKIYNTVPEELKKLSNLTIFVTDLGKNAVGSNVSLKDFRQGFWQYTKLRLCTLRELHRAYPQFSLLHVENDVLLLPDFLTFSFKSIELTSWLSHTEQDDSGAILFTPFSASTDNFVEKFMAEIQNECTNSDMRILNRIRKTFPLDFGLLPTLNSSFLDPNKTLSSENTIDEVCGFDPAFLGIWMFGDDARNRLGLSKRFTFLGRGKAILSELLDFDPKERSLFINKSKQKTKVYSVHVHSKKTEVFSALWASEIENAVLISRRGRPTWNFNFKIFVEVLADYKRRGKLHTLVIALPVIGKFIAKLKSSVSS